MTTSLHIPRAYVRGAATLLDISGTGVRAHRERSSAGAVDQAAVYADWQAVLSDFRAAYGRTVSDSGHGE